jgi:hypothetical protein
MDEGEPEATDSKRPGLEVSATLEELLLLAIAVSS